MTNDAQVPPPPPPPPSDAPIAAYPKADSNQRTEAVIAHGGGILLTWLIPLLVYMSSSAETKPFTHAHAKEALNFQITIFIGLVLSNLVPLIGGLLTIAIFVVSVVLGIKGMIAANAGESFRYPFAIRFIN